MSEDTIWNIAVEDKDNNEIVIKRELSGGSPPNNELAAVLIQDQLLGDSLLPAVGRDCQEPTVYRLKVGGYTIKSICRA